MESVLHLYHPHLSGQLVSPTAYQRIEDLVRGFPASLSSTLVLECRLSAASLVDFSFCVDPMQGARLTATLIPPVPHPIWQRVQQFAQQWLTDPELQAQIAHLWLEFDGENLIPSVYIGPKITTTQIPLRLTSWRDDLNWLIEKTLPVLWGEPTSEITRENFLACVDALPAETQIFEIGLMLARQSKEVRLCLMGILDPVQYLENIRWQGEIDHIALLIKTILPYLGGLDIYLDVGEEIRPRLGLECRLTPSRAWLPFLNWLVENHLCTPEKRDTLGSWGGAFKASLPHLDGQYIFRQVLSHIKLVYELGKPLQAKAYLSLFYRQQ